MKSKAKTTAFLGVCVALALIFAYIEVLLPPLFPAVPGIKMGLPNIIITFLIYRKNYRTAVLVSLIRIVLATMLFSNLMSFLYSLSGAVLSLAIMVLFKHFNLLSTVGVSVAGGVAHNVGQILMAMLLLETTQLGYYLAVLTVTGIIAGIFVGLCASLLIKKVPARLLY